ncbi:MAG: SDR family oxidoreductase [Actinomycetota bacterium]|nr:SDR family oxidoreductase [Actinomycetota bacterium]
MTRADKQTIFITGAASGIGRATAKYFAERDWDVIASARSWKQDGELEALPNVEQIDLDITDLNQIHEVVGDVTGDKQIDVVFNNAGSMLLGPMEEFTDEQLVHQVTTNLLGPLRVTQAFIPHFRKRGGGLFINTTSLSAVISGPFMAVYAATKAGLERWSFGLNLELNPFGIRVKTIVPGIVATNIMNSATVVQGAPYEAHMDTVLSVFGDPEMQEGAPKPEGTAAVVLEAATDGSERIRYLADQVAIEQVSKTAEFGEEQAQSNGARAMFGEPPASAERSAVS